MKRASTNFFNLWNLVCGPFMEWWYSTPASRCLRLHKIGLCSQLTPRWPDKRISPLRWAWTRGGEARYLLRPWKAVSHTSFQQKSASFFFKAWKKGLHLSVDRSMNRAKRHQFSIWTSFIHVSDFIFKMADIWLGLASMPRWVTRYPKNFPEATLNVHLSGLSFTLYSVGRKLRTNVGGDPSAWHFSPTCHQHTLPLCSWSDTGRPYQPCTGRWPQHF